MKQFIDTGGINMTRKNLYEIMGLYYFKIQTPSCRVTSVCKCDLKGRRRRFRVTGELNFFVQNPH